MLHMVGDSLNQPTLNPKIAQLRMMKPPEQENLSKKIKLLSDRLEVGEQGNRSRFKKYKVLIELPGGSSYLDIVAPLLQWLFSFSFYLFLFLLMGATKIYTGQ